MSIIIVLALSGLGAVARTVSEDENFEIEKLTFSKPILNENNNYISIKLEEMTHSSWEKNRPSLPVVTKVFTFPFGTIVDNVKVIFSEKLEKVVSKPIKPSPEVYMESTMYSYIEAEKSNDILTYADINIYPEESFSYKVAAGLKGEEHVIYLSVHLSPVQYNPKEKMIYYSTSATIDIEYTLPENPILFPDEYDYLILSPVDFENALQTLVDHKNSLEPPIRTKLVTLDEIPSAGGIDIQEDIKLFIKDAIENWGITYVLLVGAGVEGSEIFPVRQAWIKSDDHEDYFPSDLYFADIYNGTGAFSNWDKDGDGKFAEYPVDMDNVDAIPDVYLGKLPCNNVAEVNVIVGKIIQYKEHNKMTNKILQAGGDSFTSDNVNEGEYANTVVMTKLPGYSTTQLWGSNQQLTKSNIAKGFRSSVDFVDFCGHGSWASFATHPPKDGDTWIPPKTIFSWRTGFLFLDFDIYMVLNSKKYPICVYKSCSNNKYSDSATCFGWKTVSKNNGGGIAAYAASGISYGATGQDIVDRTTGWMEVKTFEMLVNNKVLGQVWGNSITDYYNTFSIQLSHSDWKTLLEWSMFGDPTLVAEDGDDPVNLPVDIPVIYDFLDNIIENHPIMARILLPIIEKLISC
jgi:hypothetical protein